MIISTRGDLLKVKTEALVNTVNTVGVMGKGLALQFKIAYPDNYRAYRKACNDKILQPGKMFVFYLEKTCQYIINFPTKRHWRDKSRLVDIEAGLRDLVRTIKEKDIKSVAIPPLGCGLGGLSWSQEVKPLIEGAFAELSEVIEVLLFEPRRN